MDKIQEKTFDGIFNVGDRIFNHGEIKQTLERKWKRLVCRRDDVITQLKHEEASPNKKRKNEVRNWLEDIDNIRSKVQNSLGQSRRDAIFGENAGKILEEVKELIEMGSFEGGLVMDVEDDGEVIFPTTEPVGETFQTNKNEIWECLVNDDISSIGVYGMGGSGKTTLMKHIHNQLQENDHTVYWITVSQDFRIDKLQTLIAERIKLDLSNEHDISTRAARLLRALKGKKKCVLILDDLWNYFDLNDVGIPGKESGCKLVLTTRSLDVCHKMSCEKKIRVITLDENEAWRLFQVTLGASLPSDDFTDIAKSITKECDGLPLGIVTMAGSMRGVDDIHEWRNALRGLKESLANNDDMIEKVFPVLRFSYHRLSDPTLQQCFLYCALYPEDDEIEREELIERMIDEEIIQEESRKVAFDKGHTMLNRLEKICLLESVTDFEERKCVKMHDLIRDMAIQISEKGVMVKAGARLEEIPDCEKWTENLLKVSLIGNDIEEIPPAFSPICPKLSTLLLRENYLFEISNLFFEQLYGLKVLDLSFAHIEELPNSISDLVNLNVLLLHSCMGLTDLPSLEKLKALKKLDLKCCENIKKLPQGIEFLSKLRYLDLRETGIKELPVGIFGRLLHLQFLKVDCYLEGKELVFLRKLENLVCEFRNAVELSTFTSSLTSNLDCYSLLVDESDGPSGFGGSFDNFLSLPSSTSFFAPALPHSTFSQLGSIGIFSTHMKKLFPSELASNFQNLEILHVCYCDEMEEIIATEEEDESHDNDCRIQFNLPKLWSLELRDLPNLKSICRGDIICNSLEEIAIINCALLKRIPLSLLVTENEHQLSPLPSLETIQVYPKEWWESVELVHPDAKNILSPLCEFTFMI